MRATRTRLLTLALALCAFTGFIAAQSANKPVADVNQLMRGLFFPHSNVVFATQRIDPAEVKRAPEPSAATDPLNGVFGGWDAVENSALTMLEGSELLLTPGRPCSNGKEAPVKAPDWIKMVADLRAAAQVSLDAAKTKNQDKMIEASDVLNTSCANCHNRYRRAVRCQ